MIKLFFLSVARMVELVDTRDLKSRGPKCPCGFKSHSGYITEFKRISLNYGILFLFFQLLQKTINYINLRIK